MNWTGLRKKNDPEFNKLVDAVKSITLNPGVGYRLKRNSAGTTLEVKGGLGNDGILYPPFWVSSDGLTDDENAKPLVRVRPGTVNNEEPVTVGGHDDEDWLFKVTLTRVIYLDAELDGTGFVTACSLRIAASVPVAPEGNPENGSAPPRAYLAIAKVKYNTDETVVITNYLTGSQNLQCVVSNASCDSQVVRVIWSSI